MMKLLTIISHQGMTRAGQRLMVRDIILTVFLMLGSFLPITSVMAQVDCSQLDPRASVSTEMDGKVKASVATLYKIAKVGGSIEGKIKEEITNLQKGVPVTEQGLIKLRTLYLFCGMVANAKDISTERKVELFRVMMDVKATDEPKPKPPQQKKEKTSALNKPIPSPQDEKRAATEPQKTPQANSQESVVSHNQTGGITAHTVTITNIYSWPEAFEEANRKSSPGDQDIIASRIFWLAREPGASISLGPCPGEKCLEFQLEKLDLKEGSLVQTILLKGGGFGVKRSPQSKYLLELNNAVSIRGAQLVMGITDDFLALKMGLHPDSSFEMFTPHAYIKLTVVDIRSTSLKIKLDIKEPKEPPISPLPRIPEQPQR